MLCYTGPAGELKVTGLRLSLPPQAFLQADKPVVADDEMIDKLDIEQFACLDELPGHGNVLGRRSGIAAGVVVADDDAGAVAYNSRAEYLGGTQHGAIDGTLVAADIVYDLVLGIEHQDTHLFVVEVGHFHHHEVSSVLWRGDLVLLIGL